MPRNCFPYFVQINSSTNSHISDHERFCSREPLTVSRIHGTHDPTPVAGNDILEKILPVLVDMQRVREIVILIGTLCPSHVAHVPPFSRKLYCNQDQESEDV
ncbi:hypothetical protein RB195_014280 [Necator americanus]|uniref:Uncharacterized protein n=1 Tax=Necator americanus TaxID=51031 RepID=A0ABR1DZJ7_NECAM